MLSHSITIASISSFVLYSSPKTWIRNPLEMTFGTVLGGTIYGSIISIISSKSFRPHVATCIVGISLMGVFARLLGLSKLLPIKRLIGKSLSEMNFTYDNINNNISLHVIKDGLESREFRQNVKVT